MRFDKSASILAGAGSVVADGILAPKDLDLKSPCKSLFLNITDDDQD